jgi:hypothetical protein
MYKAISKSLSNASVGGNIFFADFLKRIDIMMNGDDGRQVLQFPTQSKDYRGASV